MLSQVSWLACVGLAVGVAGACQPVLGQPVRMTGMIAGPDIGGGVGAGQVAEGPLIEVVFVLDTTGSMSGLIEGAKQKVWSIANAIVTGEPNPRVRMGLVAYRDVTDAYVTQRTALTDDLDAVYSALMGFSADGGGDGPESVNQALHEAVTGFDWTSGDDVLRIVYLVGDAPPHMDYEQDVKYPASCEQAAEVGLIINTIQCGSQGDTTPIWQEIARLAEGEYFQIDQSGGMTAIATPYDEELAALGRQIGDSMVSYGTAMEQTRARHQLERAEGVAAAAPAEALADRAAYLSKAGEGAWSEVRDLVSDVEAGRVALKDVPEKELPAEMQSMSEAERAAYVTSQAQLRSEARARIEALTKKRDGYIQDEMARLGATDSFDTRVLESLRRQAARVGVTYE